MYVNLYVEYLSSGINQYWTRIQDGSGNYWYRVVGHPMFDPMGEMQFLCQSGTNGVTNVIKVIKTSPTATDWTDAGIWIKQPSTTAFFVNLVYPVGSSCNPSYVIPAQSVSVVGSQILTCDGNGTLCPPHDTLQISSNTNWTMSTSDYWIHFSPNPYTGYGDVTNLVSLASMNFDSNSGSDRTGFITLHKYGLTDITITVQQNASGVSCS